MPRELKFVFEVTPQPKQRPRFGNGRTYTPGRTKNYEDALRVLAKAQMVGKKMLTGPLAMEIRFYFPMSKSVKYKTDQDFHTKRPDADNAAKAIMDALNSIAYADDSQIAVLHAVKCYFARPFIWCDVRELE